jgi:hypothetical protein
MTVTQGTHHSHPQHDDPEMILEVIKAAYGKSSFATRHNALQALLAVTQEASESVTAFIGHAHEALHFLKSTRPPCVPPPSAASGSTPLFSLQDSDRELLISVLLCGTCYSSLTTSLLAQSDLTLQQVEDALKNEEVHRVGAAAAAMVASVPPAGSHLATPASGLACTFCGRSGHTVECCFKFEDYSKKAKKM